MEAGGESDSELEGKARAQAEAIVRSRAEALAEAQRGGLPAMFERLGSGLRRSKERASSAVGAVQKPGRELLLWQMRQSTDLAAAWDIAFVLMEEARFVTTVPAGRPCPIAEFKAQRSWDVAASEWNKMGGGTAETWIKCDRQLLLLREANKVVMKMTGHDINLRFDPSATKLIPIKTESDLVVSHQSLAMVMAKFPNLGVEELSSGLRAPGRPLNSGRRNATDAFVTHGRMQGGLEPFNQGRGAKKDDKEDAGKGFLTWLSGLMKNNGQK